MDMYGGIPQKNVYEPEECTLYTDESGSVMYEDHLLIFRKPDKDHRWTKNLNIIGMLESWPRHRGKIIWKGTEITFVFVVG